MLLSKRILSLNGLTEMVLLTDHTTLDSTIFQVKIKITAESHTQKKITKSTKSKAWTGRLAMSSETQWNN